MKVTLQEIRERTYKPVDAWWTVLLVDPLASRLVRLVAPYRWITPNVLTLIASIFGFGAAACFAVGDRWALVAGGILFHISFVVDCMDGKIARLNGTGTMFGQWLDFVLDRVRVFFIALALFGGQYAKTHDVAFLWLMAVAIFLDLFRYLNSAQMTKVRNSMKDQIAAFRVPTPVEAEPAAGMGEPADEMPEPAVTAPGNTSLKRRIGATLRRNRIRTHLISGIEYEMSVFIIAPITGLIFPVTIAAGAGLLAFEAFLIFKLYRTCQQFPGKLAAAQAAYDEQEPDRIPSAV
ncbi:CDP-alcohol phosphatidyltransferase family protein [Actinoplanes sp. NEAU-A12]|uniref:CDP-alcohol phosphatidyltransferase family protein n=1 Tax=Actinoplanes sandaracinus TaxID=3045177 RepID=A0ABT6WTY1_9ACTN|nr:CDP-alcohol phosphatidyltransferase family protein [Actinoplanes sandaracinus]MDI6103203.1 CDP-alcohol phosphatidyltransferase family protein [Actinoplanes sandaracinus]